MTDCKRLSNALGRVVVKRRIALGLDREGLAKRLGESIKYVQAVEEGRQYLFLTDIHLMAEALDVPIVDLMREAESEAGSD